MNAKVPFTPLVSIAMCTHNGEQFLREQLDSLIAQDYLNLEIIITDDCSTDGTQNILREYEKKHDFITVYINESNLGFIKNFEKALLLCSGEFISLCDQDDIWFPHKTSTLVAEIGDASLIYSKLSLIDENGKPANKKTLRFNRLNGRCNLALLFANCVTGHVALIKKDVLESALPIPDGIPYHDHWIAFISASKNGIKALEKPLSLYRIHTTNASVKKPEIKNKNPLKRRIEKKNKRHKTLELRILFLENALHCNLLSKEEIKIVRFLLEETTHLKSCFINRKLKKYLAENKTTLLPIFLNPKNACNKLSRGALFYKLRLYT